MKYFTESITLTTTEPIDFVDITERVRKAVSSSGVTSGMVHVYSHHTTTAIKINERCDRLQDDMKELLQAVAPLEKEYRHNEATVDGRANAHSHLMSLILNASESIPVVNSSLVMGDWQSVFFVELDGPRESRTAMISVIGV